MSNALYTFRHDGSHLIAYAQSTRKEEGRIPHAYGLFKDEYEDIYIEGIKALKGPKESFMHLNELPRMENYVYLELCRRHPEYAALDQISLDEVRVNVHRIYKMHLARYRTLKRKVQNNPWNWFITLTYDSGKFASPEQFMRTVKTTLNHFAVNRGWRYIGRFEDGEEGGRRHLHLLAWIPEGEMVGKVELRGNYSQKKHKYLYTGVNTFFLERFGWNEFAHADQMKVRGYDTVQYLTKYISKEIGKFFYSRYTPKEFKDLTFDEEAFVHDEEGHRFAFSRFTTNFILDPEKVIYDPITASFFEGEFIGQEDKASG